MNKKQIGQTIIGGLAIVLIIVWIISPVPLKHKLLGIFGNVLLAASMLISYLAEEKNKKDKL